MGQGSSSQKFSEQDKAILQMKTQRDRLQQYQKKISIVAARETDIARECLRQGDKKKALVALRRKKYQETLLANTDKHLEQLEQLVNDVEFARVQKDVLYGLQEGTSVLKMMQKEMGGLEGVERLLGESEEAKAYTKEVNEMLAGRMSNIEEDEVEEELEALEKQVNSVEEKAGRRAEALPSVPFGDLPERKENRKERWERRAREQQEEMLAA